MGVNHMQTCEFVMSITALACCISEGKSADGIALMSSILMQLGDTLSTIAAREALCAPKSAEAGLL